jgi:type IV pilus assembly protein PilO
LEGTYNQLAKFISDTANLPRIVTLHNPTITREKSDKQDMKIPQLRMKIVTKTYRYLDQDEGSGK